MIAESTKATVIGHILQERERQITNSWNVVTETALGDENTNGGNHESTREAGGCAGIPFD